MEIKALGNQSFLIFLLFNVKNNDIILICEE